MGDTHLPVIVANAIGVFQILELSLINCVKFVEAQVSCGEIGRNDLNKLIIIEKGVLIFRLIPSIHHFCIEGIRTWNLISADIGSFVEESGFAP